MHGCQSQSLIALTEHLSFTSPTDLTYYSFPENSWYGETRFIQKVLIFICNAFFVTL